MKLSCNWKPALVSLIAIASMFMVTKRLIEYALIDELYQGKPCRYTGELTDRAELAIEHLRQLPDQKFCSAVLFQHESKMVEAAVDKILADAEVEAAKDKPCRMCLWLATVDLDDLGYNYQDIPYLLDASKFWDH